MQIDDKIKTIIDKISVGELEEYLINRKKPKLTRADFQRLVGDTWKDFTTLGFTDASSLYDVLSSNGLVFNNASTQNTIKVIGCNDPLYTEIIKRRDGKDFTVEELRDAVGRE